MKYAMPANEDTFFSMVNVPLVPLDVLFTISTEVVYIVFLDSSFKDFIALKLTHVLPLM